MIRKHEGGWMDGFESVNEWMGRLNGEWVLDRLVGDR